MRFFLRHVLPAVAVPMVLLACGGDARRPVQAPAPSPASATTTESAVWGRGPNDPTSPNPHSALPPIDQGSPPPGTAEQAPRELGDPALAPRPFLGAGPKEDQTLARTERRLTDPEVLGVIIEANLGETLVAEMAVRKASAPEVKQFAAMMKGHHGAALEKARALQKKVRIDGAPSDLSEHLKKGVDTTTRDLRDKDDIRFDRAYMASQVKAHQDVLTAIDNRLVPSVSNAEIRSTLGDMRRTVTDHLSRAKDVEQKLEPVHASREQPPTERRGVLGLGLAEPPGPAPAPAGKHDDAREKARRR